MCHAVKQVASFEDSVDLIFVGRKKGAENTILREYVLPDFSQIKRGYVRQKDDTTERGGEEQVTVNTPAHPKSLVRPVPWEFIHVNSMENTCNTEHTQHTTLTKYCQH